MSSISNTNRTIALITLLGGVIYIVYAFYQFDFNGGMYDSNLLHMFFPDPRADLIVNLSYGLIAILSGILFLKEKRFCYHLYHILSIGIVILNVLYFYDFGFHFPVLYLFARLCLMAIAVYALVYFNNVKVKMHLGIRISVRYLNLVLYGIVAVLIKVLPPMFF